MFIITSEQRVGSRWLHYLFADLLKMKTHPELPGKNIIDSLDTILVLKKENKIPKYHSAVPGVLMRFFPNAKILGIVRNPRDRLVSLSFHKRYHPYHFSFQERNFETDLEAVEHTVLHNQADRRNNYNLLNYMIPGNSTHSYIPTFKNYIWTTYEWLLADTIKEVSTICNQFGFYNSHKVTDSDLHTTVFRHSFEVRTGRKPGEEERTNAWIRKGINKDWVNWFDDSMVAITEELQVKYNERMLGEMVNSVKE